MPAEVYFFDKEQEELTSSAIVTPCKIVALSNESETDFMFGVYCQPEDEGAGVFAAPRENVKEPIRERSPSKETLQKAFKGSAMITQL